MYVTQLPAENWQGIGWVFLNSIIAVVDRLLQRLLLSKDTVCHGSHGEGSALIVESVGGIIDFLVGGDWNIFYFPICWE